MPARLHKLARADGAFCGRCLVSESDGSLEGGEGMRGIGIGLDYGRGDFQVQFLGEGTGVDVCGDCSDSGSGEDVPVVVFFGVDASPAYVGCCGVGGDTPFPAVTALYEGC